ncbi:Actin-related protein 2-A [Tritrichomonas foetus]|uniref:Actin-related protein 2-A n=1 Tax=Tritrichomonas foetus TaxID=1144522 RepID=A0A1J4K875_9EUKA|nr:actin-related protein 2-A [Tritrichomonas foetus]OHT05637.1 Actin-related protein 2-A [Tritrichomonas foetus]OHT05638.1 Actin-related protein 2-A [Tritrichomonas foetus]|eukprot:OHT05637.1 Actin-related protein 2-A [Tritrichomonas foetus]
MTSDCPIVLDLGTGFLKAGFSVNPIPDFVIPNSVGRPILRSDESFSRAKIKDVMICDEITPVRQYLDLTFPVEHGVIKNWEDETLVLDYLFKNKLKINNEDHPVLITEAPLNPLENRKKIFEVFFETFNFPAIQMAPQALLVLYAQGLVTGVVVDSGDGVTHIMPIFENYLLSHLIGRMDIAGRDITEHMVKLLTLRGYTFHKSSDFDVVREIKEKMCFVSADINVDRRIANETTTYVVPYVLNDGRIIKVSGERFEAPEVLFQPELLGIEGNGIHQLLFDTIMKSDINLRKEFFKSIVVSGGTTMYPGFSTRLENELRRLVLNNVLKGDTKALKSYKISVEDPPNRRFLVYLGATVLANLSKEKTQSWAQRTAYKEAGPEQLARMFQGGGGA